MSYSFFKIRNCFLFLALILSCETLAAMNVINSDMIKNNSSENEYTIKGLPDEGRGMWETFSDTDLKRLTPKSFNVTFTNNEMNPIGSQINFNQNFEIIFEILKKVDNKNCVRDIKFILNGLMDYEKWALQVFDSIPKFPLGLLYGNMYQLGNFDECTSVHHLIDQNLTIFGQYCLADIGYEFNTNYSKYSIYNEEIKQNPRSKFNTSLIHWGLCLPSTCTPQDGAYILKNILTSLIPDFKTLEVSIDDKKCYYEKHLETSVGEIIYGCIIAVLLLFIIFSTIAHLFHIKRRKQRITYNVETTRNQNQTSLFKEVMFSFSVIQTVKKLLKTKPTELNLECIYGIKFLSMGFIVVGHSLIFILGGPVANVDFVIKNTMDFENSIFLNGPLLVDTFLLISGFLMCRLLLLELDKRNGNINFLILYITRYIRLTPAYLVILGFYLTWFPKIGNGPLWKETIGKENERCLSSWWTNPLYINNYVRTDSLCMFQSWYLAADYHLFIISPFIVYPLWKWQKFGTIFLAASTMFVASLPIYFTFRDNLDPTLLAFPPEIQDISSNYYFTHAYIKTHMRASSYFLGLVFGYVIHKIQLDGIKISKYIIWIGWILSIVLGLTSMISVVVFFNTDHYNILVSALYSTLHRIMWCLSVGWVIIMCVTDNAASVNKFLAWNFFVPLSRLTYCAYLANGLVVLYHKGTIREAAVLSKYSLFYTLNGHLVLTFLCAFVLCVCFESPIHGIEKILLRRNDTQQKRSDASNS